MNQIKTVLLVFEAVKTIINDQAVWGVCGKGHLGVSFLRGQRVQTKWVVGGGGLYGYFGEQGLPVGVQECLEGSHRKYADYFRRQFVPKWDSPNGEKELATTGTTSLLVELIGVAA